jgi:hypothetical protein
MKTGLKQKSPPVAGGQSKIFLVDQPCHRAAGAGARHHERTVELAAIAFRQFIGGVRRAIHRTPSRLCLELAIGLSQRQGELMINALFKPDNR